MCFFQRWTVITHENVPENWKPTHWRPEKRLQREWSFKTNTKNNGSEPLCKDTQTPICKLFFVSPRLNCRGTIYCLQMLWTWDTEEQLSWLRSRSGKLLSHGNVNHQHQCQEAVGQNLKCVDVCRVWKSMFGREKTLIQPHGARLTKLQKLIF